MSEELAAESVGLDPDEGATIVGQVAAPETPPADTDADPEGTIDASGGIKFVPLDALKAERTQRKEAAGKLSALEAEIAALRPKAEKLEQIHSEWQQLE